MVRLGWFGPASLLLLTLAPACSREAGAPSIDSTSRGLQAGEVYAIFSRLSGKVLDVKDGSMSEAAEVQQWDYVGNQQQHFLLEDTGQGDFFIAAQHSGRVLDLSGRDPRDGAVVVQAARNGGSSQRWELLEVDPGQYEIRNRLSGKALDVAERATTNGARIQQWSFTGGDNQRWTFSPIATGGVLRALGTQIVDGAGRRVLLRTAALGNWLLPEGYMWKFDGPRGDRARRIEDRVRELLGDQAAAEFWRRYRQSYVTERDIERIAALGFNSVRVAMNARLLYPEGGDTFDEEEFGYLRDLVDWCTRHEIYVIFDMHGAPGGQTGKNIDDSANDHPELFRQADAQDRLITLWTEIARRFAGERYVAAYDLLNEPLPGEFSYYNGQLWPIYRRVAQAIRAVDADHLLVVEGAGWANDWSALAEPFDPNLVYSFHKYWNASDISSIRGYLDHRARWNRPVWVGEIGENSDQWYRDNFRLLEENDIGWCFWPWKKMESGNNPYSIALPRGWGDVQRFVRDGGAQPAPGVAQAAFDELIENVKIEHAQLNPGVVDAIFPPW